MVTGVGWYVRVKTGVITDEVYDTVLYIAGFPNPVEAEAAVRKAHGPAEEFEVLDGEIVPGIGPQPNPGEVRLIGGV